jgi:hypothetical protein
MELTDTSWTTISLLGPEPGEFSGSDLERRKLEI